MSRLLLLLFMLTLTVQGQEYSSTLIFTDCKHLILPFRCQCYHSGDQSQLRCQNIQLDFIPKLPNNMRWFAMDFSSNNLTSIDSYMFSDLYVEKLNFQSNQLETIDVTSFDKIQNLKQLFLHRNQLKEFDPSILIYPGTSLEILDLSWNPLFYLDLGEIFFHLSVLRQFSAVSCQLNRSSLLTLLKLIEDHRPHLELIDLSWNNFTTLCDRYFSAFDHLKELRLEHNQIYRIDPFFIASLSHLKVLHLASNSLKTLPNLQSQSLEILNLSSNHLESLDDYFGSNLHSIRQIDFDGNQNLQRISSRAFCFLNLLTLEKLSFRSNNLSSIDSFEEIFCRFINEMNSSRTMIEVNNNVNLICHCLLVQFESYLYNYRDLTCIRQGQDRYFISKLASSYQNCSWTTCRKDLCLWSDVEQMKLKGTCQDDDEHLSTNILTPTTTTTMMMNTTPLIINATKFSGLFSISLKSFAVKIIPLNFIWISLYIFPLILIDHLNNIC